MKFSAVMFGLGRTPSRPVKPITAGDVSPCQWPLGRGNERRLQYMSYNQERSALGISLSRRSSSLSTGSRLPYWSVMASQPSVIHCPLSTLSQAFRVPVFYAAVSDKSRNRICSGLQLLLAQTRRFYRVCSPGLLLIGCFIHLVCRRLI